MNMSNHCTDTRDLTGDRQFENLRHAVQCNCHISDARHAGNYSLCIYLLKMRELFRWEQGFALTDALPRAPVGDWLSEREALWDELAEAAYAPLPVYGVRHDPFEAETINQILLPRGLVYGGGIGPGGKPLFFLGTLLRDETRNGLRVLLTDDEHARDLTAPPAMLRGRTITVRRQSLRRMLWERVEGSQWQRRDGSLLAAVIRDYGMAEAPEQALDRMTEDEIETVVQHELGEAWAGERLGDDWEAMLADLGRSRAEFVARAVRDHLADCHATLPALLTRDDDRSLRLYLGGLDGLRRELFPRLLRIGTDDADALQDAASAGVAHWEETARAMLASWREHGAAAAPEITARAESATLN
jgi:hypothetical protein